MSINLKSLVGKLNYTCKTALEGAAALCVSQTNYEIDLLQQKLPANELNESTKTNYSGEFSNRDKD